MIIMKFGGTSVADAGRVLAVAEIVRAHLDRAPVVVVSALAGVTDLLVAAVDAARRGDREALEPILADLERRHRWALAGSIEDPGRRHDLSLEMDALFEELRQLLRAVRILGEGTPQSSDALLAFGEALSSRILRASLEEKGVRAKLFDPRDVLVTDERHGAAEPDLSEVAARASGRLVPALGRGETPVLGGFVGATREGRTTTLGRGGSDTTAAVLGSALGAEEIQIWTDVDGLMSADPKLVAAARTLDRVSFAEAAELAHYGAKVLHPASIAPAVRRAIPVRVLNSFRPEGRGTEIVEETGGDGASVASVASRGGLATIRVTSSRMRVEPGLFSAVLGSLERRGSVPELMVSSEVSVTVAVPDTAVVAEVEKDLRERARIEIRNGRAIVCLVGSGLAREESARRRALAALAALAPELVSMGGSGSSAAAVIPEDRLGAAVRELHRRFVEDGATGEGKA